MKLAVLICFIAFTCVSQAQLLSWMSSSSSALLDSAKAKLEDAKSSVGRQLDNAVDVVQEKITEPKDRAEQLFESLSYTGNELLQGVTTTLETTLDAVNETVDGITKEAAAENVDIAECRTVDSHLRGAALNFVARSSNCVLERISTGRSLIGSIISQSRDVLNEVINLRKKYNECFDGVEGVVATTRATACVSKTGVKATWTVSKTVPAVAADIAKMTVLVSTLQTSLPACVSKAGLTSLATQSKSALGNVKSCVTQKIQEAKNLV